MNTSNSIFIQVREDDCTVVTAVEAVQQRQPSGTGQAGRDGRGRGAGGQMQIIQHAHSTNG